MKGREKGMKDGELLYWNSKYIKWCIYELQSSVIVRNGGGVSNI